METATTLHERKEVYGVMDVLDVLKTVVYRKPKDYVYPNGRTKGCTYATTLDGKEVNCLAGAVFRELEEVDDRFQEFMTTCRTEPDDLDGGYNRRTVNGIHHLPLSTDAQEVLDSAQTSQDIGNTWRTALRKAIVTAQDLGYQAGEEPTPGSSPRENLGSSLT